MQVVVDKQVKFKIKQFEVKFKICLISSGPVGAVERAPFRLVSSKEKAPKMGAKLCSNRQVVPNNAVLLLIYYLPQVINSYSSTKLSQYCS